MRFGLAGTAADDLLKVVSMTIIQSSRELTSVVVSLMCSGANRTPWRSATVGGRSDIGAVGLRRF